MLMASSYIKEPKSFEEQLITLKEKNVIIEDEQHALDILSQINYYRLILKDKDKAVDQNGVTFKQLKRFYDFDKRLRELFIYYLEAIEIEFQTKIAYYHVHDFGSLGYRDSIHFKSGKYYQLFLKKLEDGISQSSKELFVIHHRHKYEDLFPFWVVIEIASFGYLSII